MKRLWLLCIGVAFLNPFAFADATETTDGIFMTLTRTAKPANDLPINTGIVGKDQFRAYRPSEAGEILTRQTSVQTLPYGGLGSLSTVRMRGSTSNQTLVLIDGRPLTGARLGPANLAEIPVERIDHIEILRGGASALYGPNAIGGVINVITKKGTPQPTLTVEAKAGSFGREELRGTAGGQRDGIDYFVYGSQKRETGFRQNSDALSRYGGGNASMDLGSRGIIRLDVDTFVQKLGLPGLLFPSIPTNQFDNNIERQASSPLSRQDTTMRSMRVSHDIDLPADMHLATRLYGLERDTEFSDPSITYSGQRVEQSKGAETQLDLPMAFMVGGNFSRDLEDSRDRIDPTNSFHATLETWGFFAQKELRWRNTQFIASGRYDHFGQSAESKSPRFQGLVDVTDQWRVSASAGHSFRPPTADDLFFRSTFFNGNPNLRPEKAWTYDAGVEWHRESDSVRVAYFRADVRDLIQVQPVTFDTVTNIGRARRQGAEIEATQRISDQWSHRLNYTFLDNKGIPSGFTEYVRLANSPQHTANHLLTWRPRPAWQGNVITRWLGSRYAGNNQTGTKLGSQVTWDLRADYQRGNTGFYFGVNDVLDKRYEEQVGFPLPGRTFFGGVACRFTAAAR